MADRSRFSSPALIALRRGGQRFFAWWLGELAAMVPAKVRRWWRGTSGIALLSLDGARAIFSRPTDKGLEETFSVEVGEHGLSLPPAAVRQRLAKVAGQGYRLLFALPASQVLERTLTLPAALAENLRQTLSFELDRYTPFRPEQAYFDFRLSEPSPGASGAGSLRVELAVVPKAVVEQHLARVAALGLDVGGVVLPEDFRNPHSRYRNFLPAASIPYVPSARFKQRIAFGMLAVVLLLALLAIPIWQKRTAAIDLLAPVAQAKAAAQEADVLRDKLGKLVEEHDLLPNKKWDSHSATRALEELTKLLPDDTFVMQLDFDGKTVQVLGETASSSGMVETIEGSPLFKDVAFKSPLTKIQGSPFDRFQIGAALDGAIRPKPEPAKGESASSPVVPVAAQRQGTP
jgi:general secretion pathway protein L